MKTETKTKHSRNAAFAALIQTSDSNRAGLLSMLYGYLQAAEEHNDTITASELLDYIADHIKP